MKAEIVIARYNEDLEWIKDIPQGYSVVIYNKGPADIPPATSRHADRVIKLKEGGRDPDTFLRHILAKDRFEDAYTVFLQGDPFEHSPDVLALLGVQEDWSEIQPLSSRWRPSKNIPPASLLARETGHFIRGARLRPEFFSLATWEAVQFADPGSKFLAGQYRKFHQLDPGANIAADFLRRCDWPAMADEADRHLVGRFSYGGCFAVRQERLASLPRPFLERALEAANSHFLYGYILERLWLHLCGEPFLVPTGHPQATDSTPTGAVRFAPPHVKPPLHQRVIPGAKRRILMWAHR